MIKTGQTTTASDLVLALTAGEALTARDACYISTADGKAYKCDADDTTKLRFAGFAQEAASLNAAVNVVPDGFLGGFSSLTPGSTYYLSGTAGAITTTPGTYEVPIGVALSATTVLLRKGTGYANGTTTFSSTTTTTITVGFQVRAVRVYAQVDTVVCFSQGGWTQFGGNRCVRYIPSAGTKGDVSTTLAWMVGDGTSAPTHSGVVDTITSTTFRLNNTEAAGTTVVAIFWEAEGDF